jgi:hypothetical protein
MGVIEGIGHLARYGQGGVDGELHLAVESLAERLPLHVRHGVPQEPVCLTGVEDRQKVGVVEASGEPDLPEEPVGPQCGSELGMEHLEGYRPVVPEIAGQVHGSHAAAPQLALDAVAVGQSGLETSEDFGQVDSPSGSLVSG